MHWKVDYRQSYQVCRDRVGQRGRTRVCQCGRLLLLLLPKEQTILQFHLQTQTQRCLSDQALAGLLPFSPSPLIDLQVARVVSRSESSDLSQPSKSRFAFFVVGPESNEAVFGIHGKCWQKTGISFGLLSLFAQ